MIEVRDACFSFDGARNVVDHVSLDVAPGERVVLLGLNGSGKSTLARLLNGSLRPSSGNVRVDGEAEGLARLVGYVRQDPRNQIVSAVVSDEVAFGPRNLGLPRVEVLARVDEALSACGIGALRDRMTSELSGGQQQLVALAGVLAMRPRYLVLDEATSMLDQPTRARVARIVEETSARGVGVLEISHRPMAAPDRTLRMSDGRVFEGGAPSEASGVPAQPCMSRGTSALRGSNLTAAYGTHVALDDVSIDARGLTLLLGPSGAGKTTLARVLTGVLAPDSGTVTLDGRPVRAGDVGLAFQRPEDQLFCDTVLDDIAYGPRVQGVPEDEALSMARDAAALLGIGAELHDRSPFELSGGQMRRVALAGVVASRPGAYVLDEPTAGLDAPSRRALRELVLRLAGDGASVLLVTHDPDEWLPLASAVVRLEDGRVREAVAHA